MRAESTELFMVRSPGVDMSQFKIILKVSSGSECVEFPKHLVLGFLQVSAGFPEFREHLGTAGFGSVDGFASVCCSLCLLLAPQASSAPELPGVVLVQDTLHSPAVLWAALTPLMFPDLTRHRVLGMVESQVSAQTKFLCLGYKPLRVI